MKKVYKLKDVYSTIFFTFPIWNSLLCFFGNEGLTNNISRIFTFLFFLISNKYLIKVNLKKAIIMDFVLIVNLIYVYLKTNSLFYLVHMDVYLFWFLLISLFFWSEKSIYFYYSNYISERPKIAKINFIITIFLLLMSIIFGNGFIASQRTVVFKGFFNIEHSLAYHLIVSYIMLLCSEVKSNNLHFIEKIIISLFILLTGVRSAFLVLLFLLLFDFIYMKKWQKILVILMLFFSVIYIFISPQLMYKIPLINKTVAAANAGDIENGRTELNEFGLNYYLNRTTYTEKFFGVTMMRLRQIYWNGLHAHNDFINILLGYGFLYLLLFFILLFKIFKGKNFFFSASIVLFLAFFNGLFMYPELMISFPLIKYSMQNKNNFRRNKNEK